VHIWVKVWPALENPIEVRYLESVLMVGTRSGT